MELNYITGKIVDRAFRIHSDLGPGLLESVYEVLMELGLTRRGLRVQRQMPVTFAHDGVQFDEAYRVDLFVEARVVVEIKSTEKIHPVHESQLRTYVKLLNADAGLLINFGAPLIKLGIRRYISAAPPPQSL